MQNSRLNKVVIEKIIEYCEEIEEDMAKVNATYCI